MPVASRFIWVIGCLFHSGLIGSRSTLVDQCQLPVGLYGSLAACLIGSGSTLVDWSVITGSVLGWWEIDWTGRILTDRTSMKNYPLQYQFVKQEKKALGVKLHGTPLPCDAPRGPRVKSIKHTLLSRDWPTNDPLLWLIFEFIKDFITFSKPL